MGSIEEELEEGRKAEMNEVVGKERSSPPKQNKGRTEIFWGC